MTHQAVTTRGVRIQTRETLEKLAADHASRARDTSAAEMAFLHVDPEPADRQDAPDDRTTVGIGPSAQYPGPVDWPALVRVA
jgi:hypothetical protein